MPLQSKEGDQSMTRSSEDSFDEATADAPVTPWPQAERDALAKWKQGRWSIQTILWDGTSEISCNYIAAIVCKPWDVTSSSGEFTLVHHAFPTQAEKSTAHDSSYCFGRFYDFKWSGTKHVPTKVVGGMWGKGMWVKPV
jgi:hypothetical protein